MKNIEALLHTRGESQYVDDMPKPAGLLYAAIFSSPVAHGEIISLNTERAARCPGVAAVVTASDIPGENQIGPIIQDEPLLAEEAVHFAGQPIALVVAESPEATQAAAREITVKIAERPAVVDPREAFKRGEIIGTPRTFSLGDVDAAWAKCDLIVEGTCHIGGQEHVYLETQRARAVPVERGGMRIYSSTQSPYAVQRTAAKVLGVAHHKIEVDVKRLGGGFGGKEDQATAWSCLAALVAWKTGRPVELVLSRADDIKMTGKRHPYISDFKIGLTKKGKILAYEVKHYQNSGAAADLSTAILERTLFHSTNCYFIPNVRAFAACCRTNLPPNTAFRGFGGPQGMFVIESAISKAAEKLGRPREEIQQANLLQKGNVFPYGQQAPDDRIPQIWNRLVHKFDYADQRDAAKRFNAKNHDRKKGLAIMPVCFGISFTSTFLNQAAALVHVYTDGSVSVTTGGIEMGQGLNTNIAAIAAKTLGIHPERIKVESTNTTRIANMSPSAASATTLLNGSATLLACNQILERLKQFVARELNVADSALISLVKEDILCDGHTTGWSWTDLVQKAYQRRINLSAHAHFATPNIYYNREQEKGRPFAYHVCGAALVEATVDCLRGTYDIDSVKIVHDLGRPISELVDCGQIEGGLAQGLGWMTMEELKYNEQGQYISNSLATYKVPEVYFMPDDIEIELLDAEEPVGPFGSKAVGEPPFMYGIGAFFAIRNAMQAFRPEQEMAFDAPLTPERVLLQLYSSELQQLAPERKQVSSQKKRALA